MTWCWRMSPLVVVALVALRARWLVSLITRSAGRGAGPAPSWTLSWLRGSGTAVSLFFVWIYVVLGVILILTLITWVLKWVIGEIGLQRECHRPIRDVRAALRRPDWAAPTRTGWPIITPVRTTHARRADPGTGTTGARRQLP